MAISERNIGVTWLVVTADTVVPIIGGGALAGDRMFLFCAWKAFGTTAQITSPVGWTKVTEFADGTVAPAANVGSVKVGAWYHDWLGDGSETDPTLDFSVAPVPGILAGICLQKGASDVWDTPAFATAAIAAVNPWSATASAALDIAAGDMLMCGVGFRDDSATMTRPATTAVDAAGITWDGNYHESPATHGSTTTSNDISADFGYRIATAGSVNVAPTAAGTLSAAETGSALWIKQGLVPGERFPRRPAIIFQDPAIA